MDIAPYGIVEEDEGEEDEQHYDIGSMSPREQEGEQRENDDQGVWGESI